MAIVLSQQDYWSRDSYAYLRYAAGELGTNFDLPPLIILLLRTAKSCGLNPTWSIIVINMLLWGGGLLLLYRLTENLFPDTASRCFALLLYATLPELYQVTTSIQRDIGYLCCFLLLLEQLSEITVRNRNWPCWCMAGVAIMLGIGWRREGIELFGVAAIWLLLEYCCATWRPFRRNFVLGVLTMLTSAAVVAAGIALWCHLGGIGYFSPLQLDRLNLIWKQIFRVL